MTGGTDGSDGDDLARLVDAARGWLAAGHRVAIATVIETWGSAPRATGSHLVVRDDGLFEGSVSGGCVEGEVIVAAQDLSDATPFVRLDYGVADARAWEVGLACGGRIAVLVQAIDDAAFQPALLDRIDAARRDGLTLTLATDLATGTTRATDAPDATDFVRTYPPRRRVAIVGAVHIAQALVGQASLLGIEATVIDPRGLFAAGPRFDAAVDSRWPDEALAEWRPNAASAVVALTHDPKLDDVALAAALRSPAFYIAALGSRKNHAGRLERLRALGFDDTALARIHGPAGLDIGARGPAEIALSIAAQMVAAMRGKA